MPADMPNENAASGEGPIGSTDRRGARSREEALAESALLHAIRASILRLEVERHQAKPRRRFPVPVDAGAARLAIGRATHRVRFAVLVGRRTIRSMAEDGGTETFDRIRRHLGVGNRPAPIPDPAADTTAAAAPAASTAAAPADVAPRSGDGAGAATPEAALPVVYARPITRPARDVFAPRVLIVAELSIPQCAKYRVWQKKALIESLGVPCTVLDWHHGAEASSRLQTHTLLLLYRVPGTADTHRLIGEARRLGVETIWEVDDLIVDPALYARNANLLTLPRAQQQELLRGSALYRDAMVAADRTIASTATLRRLMAEITGKPCDVVNNALDRETLDFAARAREEAADAPDDPERIVIAYGSGTSTHDADMAVATPALIRLLAEDPRVVLRITGPLALAPALARFGARRIERAPFTNYRDYLAALARAAIAIAPLEPTVFNDAKSNIKLIEAAIVGVPIVCSPADEFRDAITDGIDGFIAADDAGWYSALRTLVDDAPRRRAVGAAAERAVRTRYAPEAIARDAIAPMIARLGTPRPRAALRVLAVNVFYAPRSFGGATIVAEEMARRLAARDDTEVFVFASHGRDGAQPYTLSRYVDRGVDVIGVSLRGGRDDILAFDNPEMGRAFADVLDAVAPDVVHFHSIQEMGAALPRACQARSIPYAVTLHDAWWLCARQFMVRADNTYCHQRTIDLKVCNPCVPENAFLGSRMDILMQCLDAASLLLSPSASHASLYRANGIPSSQLRVNRNGVRLPPPGWQRRRGAGPLRFAFVAGNQKLKGIDLVRDAFRAQTGRDWTLVLVDATLSLGFRSFDPAEWRRLPGTVSIVPAYRQEEMDAFFADIDVLLFPSQWKESFGLTVREALVRDVWVIATDSGGAAEEIVEGVNGTLIPMRNDHVPLAAAIASTLRDAVAIRAFVNPRKHEIATLDEQATELHAFLAALPSVPARRGGSM